MIAGLKGIIHEKQVDHLVIDVSGVRYECLAALSTLGAVGEVGEDVELVIHTHVREDAFQLYGFLNSKEKKLFLSLVSVSGIGPKLGLNILSGLPAEELGRAVVDGNVARLVKIPGVGKKTAERIVLELKEKLSKLLALDPEAIKAEENFDTEDELSSALTNLGYKPKQVSLVIKKLSARFDKNTSLEKLIRAALVEMQS